MFRFLCKTGAGSGCSSSHSFILLHSAKKNSKPFLLQLCSSHLYQNKLNIHHISKKLRKNKMLFKTRTIKELVFSKSFVELSKFRRSNNKYDFEMWKNFKENYRANNIGINTIPKQRNLCSANTDKAETLTFPKTVTKIPTFDHLLSYLDVSVDIGNIAQAENILLYFIENASSHYENDPISLFNTILNAWANEGNWTKVSELLDKMEALGVLPNLQSYCAAIESIVRSSSDKNNIKAILERIENRPDLHLENLLEECSFVSDQKEKVLEGIHLVNDKFIPKTQDSWTIYDTDLFKDLKSSEVKHERKKYTQNQLSIKELQQLVRLQMERECSIQIPIPSIKKPLLDDYLHWQEIWNNNLEIWRKCLCTAFEDRMKEMDGKSSQLNLYPYLKVLKPEVYVDILLEVARSLIQDPRVGLLALVQRDLGTRVMNRYFIQKKNKNGIFEKIRTIHEKFVEYYCNTSISTKYSAREYWKHLQENIPACPTLTHTEKIWPKEVLLGVGLFLAQILLKNVMIENNPFTQVSNTKRPVFYLYLRQRKWASIACIEDIKKLSVRAYAGENMMMDSKVLPMISPPLPWMSFYSGGYLTNSDPIIRRPKYQLDNHQRQIENISPCNLYGLFDALNKLSSCGWKINEPLLDLAIDIYSNGGNPDIGIPLPDLREQNMISKVQRSVNKRPKEEEIEPLELLNIKRKHKRERKMKNETYFALSVANAFRKYIIWEPHNADTRGRCYPQLVHFKHIGGSIGDVTKSLFLFANGEELGERGIEWLKIHLINMTGIHKNSSLQRRLKYCDEILDDIMDSADKPLTGGKWWMKSKNPWQTLACCMELTKCLRFSDPTKYVCHLPVHQDGSANILQHYTALLRDEQCAELVNLVPQDKPADVYSKIAEMIELERKQDEARDIKIAHILNGCISRDIVKPIIIGITYGGSTYGAFVRMTTELSKEDKIVFPMEHREEAAAYLAAKAKDVSQKLFPSAMQFQFWLSKIANLISSVYQEPVQWMSPFGFRILQPQTQKVFDESKLNDTDEDDDDDSFEFLVKNERVPNVDRQMKSFPPNYIHTLEASHMMLTALHCERQGVEFASIHECFWTLPTTVDLMNQILREQFVALHSQPLLENLANFMTELCVTSKNENSVQSIQSEFLRVLNSPPKPGTFDIKKVLKSTYFFC